MMHLWRPEKKFPELFSVSSVWVLGIEFWSSESVVRRLTLITITKYPKLSNYTEKEENVFCSSQLGMPKVPKA